MTTSYYVPASRNQPRLPLVLAWMLWLTSKHVEWPGWVWGVIWTLWAIVLIVTVTAIFTRTAYDEQKMDRVLGEDS